MFEIFEEMKESIDDLTRAINKITARNTETDEEYSAKMLMRNPATRPTGIYIIDKTSTLREIAYWIKNTNVGLSSLGIWKFIGTAVPVQVWEDGRDDFGVVERIDLYRKK
jgi:hypothetical protein